MSKFGKTVFLLFTGVLFHSLSFAQLSYPSTDGVYYHTTPNGLGLVMLPITTETAAEITFYVKTGSVYENDSLSGLAFMLHRIIARKIADSLQVSPWLKDTNTHFVAHSTTEHSVFKFRVSAANISSCLALAVKALYQSEISEEEVEMAKDSLLEKITAMNNIPSFRMERKILARVYRHDFEKLTVTGNPVEYRNITSDIVRKFHEKYYVVNNSLITATGQINPNIVYNQVEDAVTPVPKGEFDPETITRMIHYRPMVFSSQFVIEDSVAAPEFHICRQFPGLNSNLQASYSAYLFCTIFNDPNNYIQIKARKMGALKLIAQYEANNFSSMLRIILVPSKENFYETYSFLITELGKLEKSMVNEGMMNMGKLRFKEEFDKSKSTKIYPEQIVKYWVFTDVSPYPTLSDSVFAVNEKKLSAFISEYMHQNPYVAVLRIQPTDRNNLKSDSLFSELEESVQDYVFKYRMNIVDLEGEENNIRLANLLQWLKMNDDVSIQVNGYSDQGEYDRFRDDSILVFMDSLPTFRKNMPDFIKKGYLRPDLMRAMKIVKYLYDNGISPKRLSGTAMKFSSNSSEEAEDNYKCTITLNKMRQSPSLYEQHYGKKRD